MKLLILAVCCIVAVAGNGGCNCKFEGGADGSIINAIAHARLDGQDLRIARAEEGVDEASKTIEKRFAAGQRFLAKNRGMVQRLDKLEGTGCSAKQFPCGLGRCVSSLVMCDGHEDCASGADESDETCDLPFTDGTAFEGTFFGKNRFGCDSSVSEKLRFVVVKITREPFLKSYVKIHFYTIINYRNKAGDLLQKSYTYDGYYDLATRKLVILPGENEDRQVAWICLFDASNNDSCYGELYFTGSKTKCAELHMFKKK